MTSRKKRILLGVLIAMPALYLLDDLAASPRFSTYTIRRYQHFSEKYNKYSFEPMPQIQEQCVNALLPHSGARPCWYVKRHTFIVIDVN